MSIKKSLFGHYNNEEVYCYTLDNEKNLKADIITYGGIIRTLVFDGVDVCLGRDSLDEYINNNGCFGALIGRNSNRIENSEFFIGDKHYTLAPNNGRNNLHGGICGFNKKIWESEAIDNPEPSLVLSLISKDGEEGFPGEVKVKVTYTLTKNDGISIHYEATSNKDTVVNLTNHSYFNLNGHASGIVDNHLLKLKSSFYTPNTDECIPFGEIRSVKNTAFDFSEFKKLGCGFASKEEQITMFNGYDHNFCIDGFGYRPGAVLKGDKTGIEMEMYTDRPGVQLYTGNCIETGRICKDGALYPIHGGICLETQAFPNSLKFSHFPGSFLRKDEKYDTTTTYIFKK